MEIIKEELRLKDQEWVEKHLEALKKTGRALNSSSLADKAKKEEIATVEKILKVVKEEKRDVRKIDWNNKEVYLRCCPAYSESLLTFPTGSCRQQLAAPHGQTSHIPRQPF